METLFVSYDQSLSLKELGFNERCLGAYHSDSNRLMTEFEMENTPKHYIGIKAPLKTQIFLWFETQHQLYSEILIDCTTYPKYCYKIKKFEGNPNDLTIEDWGWEIGNHSELYKSRNDVESSCIDKLIEIIRTNQK